MKTVEVFQFGEFWVDPLMRSLRRKDTPLALNRRAFEVLLYLVQNPGRVIPKDELLKNVWPDVYVDESSLTQNISSLRKALEESPHEPSYITTVPGRGYQFIAPVKVVPSTELAAPNSSADTLHSNSYLIQQRTVTTSIITEERQHRPAVLTRTMAGSLAAAALALLSIAGYKTWRLYHPPPASITIVLADFVNTTGDAAFDHTLRRALEVDLEQSPYMEVQSERADVATLRLMGRNTSISLTGDVAREVCERTNRKVLIEGSISSLGPQYLVTLAATDCSTGKTLTSVKAETKDKATVLVTVDTLAAKMRSRLGESEKSLHSFQVPLREATTPSLEALKAYSMAKYLSAQGRSGIEIRPFYERAVELDPHFAMAYGELSILYYNDNDMDASRRYMLKAYQESGQVSARERFILQAHYYDEGIGDLLRANEAYRMWGETYPDEYIPWVDIANNDNQLGLYQQAIPAGERALAVGPDMPIDYSVLMRAYTAAGRLQDAKRVYNLAMQRGKNSSGIHEFRYNIAYIEHDQKALDEANAWMETHPDDWYFIDRKAESLAASGRYAEAVGLYKQAYDITKREKLDDSADGVLIDQAQVEVWLGLDSAARATLARMSKSNAADGRDLVLVRTQLGDKSAAQHFLDAHKDDPGTLMKYQDLAQASAVVAAQQKKPLEAIAALEPSLPYELASYSVPTQLAEIYLQATQVDKAIQQYQKILANPGIDPTSPQYPLAHLGLARAYALQKDKTKSRHEYEAFFACWKDADPGLPVLRQARLEYAHLSGYQS